MCFWSRDTDILEISGVRRRVLHFLAENSFKIFRSHHMHSRDHAHLVPLDRREDVQVVSVDVQIVDVQVAA